ncbi:DUF721 domain-containing protein [bacterium]|nr:DUF721 domain-containing protein [bacterium]
MVDHGKEKSKDKAEGSNKPAIEPLRKGKGRNFQPIAKVLPKLLRQLGIDNRLKEHTFLHLWPHIVGEPFASRTRPLFIDSDGNVVIAVKDASTGQEISFAKADLLKKLKQAARGVGISINGMRFDMKRYFEKATSDEFAYQFQVPLPEPTEAELYAIELSVDEALQIAAVATNFTIEPQSNSDEHHDSTGADFSRLAIRMRTLYEKELRLKKWRLAHNYPVCSQCGDVTSRLHGANLICPLCFATGMLEMPRGGYT